MQCWNTDESDEKGLIRKSCLMSHCQEVQEEEKINDDFDTSAHREKKSEKI